MISEGFIFGSPIIKSIQTHQKQMELVTYYRTGLTALHYSEPVFDDDFNFIMTVSCAIPIDFDHAKSIEQEMNYISARIVFNINDKSGYKQI